MSSLLDSPSHLQQAERFETFLRSLPSDSPYQEWVIVIMFYSALHYVEAFLCKKKLVGRDHDLRRAEMKLHQETRAIEVGYHRLHKASSEARYDGTPFIRADSLHFLVTFNRVKAAMRQALSLSPTEPVQLS